MHIFRMSSQFLTFIVCILFSMVATHAVGAEEAAPVDPVVPQYEVPAARTAAGQSAGNPGAGLSTTGKFAALELRITDGPQSLPVSGMFNNPGGGSLIYTAASSEVMVATVSITKSILTITPVAAGATDITITARDDAADLEVAQTFRVTAISLISSGTSIPDQQLTASGGPRTLDLSDHISGPQGNPLSFTASSNDLTAATVGVDGNILTITPLAPGTATITITVRNNPLDAGITLDFQVQVANFPPISLGSSGIPDQQLVFAGPVKLLDLNDYFSDTEGDKLRYSDAVSSNLAVATVFKGDPTNFLFITPTPNGVLGTTDISVTANDRFGGTLTQVFQVETTNQAPISCCTFTTSTTTVTGGPDTIDLDDFFSDPDASSIPDHALSYKAVSDNKAVATVSISKSILTITPVKRGTADITVTASDGLENASLTVHAVVNPSAPTTTGIPNQSLSLSGSSRSLTLNLNDYFSDPDGDSLAYNVDIEAVGKKRVTLTTFGGSNLGINPSGAGIDKFTVTARKIANETAFTTQTSFLAAVDPPPPRLKPGMNIGGSSSRISTHSPQTFNLDDYFEASVPLSYRASSADSSTVRVRIDGSSLTVTPVRSGGRSTRITVIVSNGLGSSLFYVFEVSVPNNTPTASRRNIIFRFTDTGQITFANHGLYFTDLDGDPLSYTTRSNNTNIVSVSISPATGNTLLRAKGAGIASIRVTARDPLGASVTRDFVVLVSGTAPSVTATILNPGQRFLLQRIGNGTDPANQVRLDLNDYFSDADGGQPIYTVAQDTSFFVNSSLSGNILTITPTDRSGDTTITVTATDRIISSLKTTQTFAVAVVNGNPVRNDTPFEPEVTLSLGAQTLNLDNYFSDPDDDSISYALESIESDYAMVRTDRIGRADNLIITPLKRGGPVSFTITASDPFGGTSTHEFEAEVGNSAPGRMGGVPALVMNQGDGPQKLVNIDSKFFDHDGDDLTYTATPSGAGGDSVATVDVDGDILTITPLARGRVDFDIAASDGHRTSGGGLILSRPHTLSVNVKVAPTIAGTPALTVDEDSPYSFTPNGADADGDPLTYSIVNKPPWADFDTATGALTGTPLHEHVGTTTGIVISVSEPSGAEASLPAFDITVIDVNNDPEGRPVITGLLAPGALLTATTDTIRDEDGLGTFRYQWNINDGDTDTAISDADSNTYTPTETDVGKSITVTVSYTDGEGTPENLTSETVGPIRPEATVAISGGGNVAEDDNATFTVTLSASPGAAVTVDYATAAGTASADDFTAANGTLTFAAGATGEDLTRTFDVKVLPDDLVEGDESFTATLSASSLPTGFSLDTTTATATITAAGSATVAISGGGSVNEGDDATFTVTLSASPGAAVVVDYATVAGTATAGSDFTATSGTLTFAAGATGDDLSQTFDVPVLADSIVEGTESFTATLSANASTPLPTGFSLDTTTATATITAAGSATVAISGGGNVNEGDDATFTVTLSASPGAAVVVDYATVAGTATAGSDFTATSGTLTFAAGATGDDLSQTFDVPVLADSIVEGTESFTATLSANASTPLPTGFSLDTTTATATITAAGSATVAISGGGSVNEGADATFTVTLSASPGAAVVVDYATAAGTATAGSDFTATSGTLTFAAGATGDDLSQTFDVPVLADSIVEGTESFTATLSANASTPLPTGFSLDTTTATATITAAGSATVAISGGGNVNEGDDATFTVTLSASPGAAVVVDYATVAGTATAGSDFTATSGTLTFAAGATGDDLSQTFDVPVLADSIVEGTESFTATLSANASTPLPTGFSLDTTTATATITAAGSATVAISGGGNVNEGDDATFTVTLSASPGAAVVVDYATVAGTATAGSDFTATSGTLTFAAGATGDDLSQTFDVPVLADSIVEGTESFTATLSANASTPLPTGFSLDTTTATATITAAGSATVAISGGGNVNEGDDATFTVTLSASPGAAVVVDYATAAGTATAGSDFTATSGTLTFAAGATGDDLSQTFDVPVLADSIVEGTESFTATLSANASTPLPTGFSLDTTTATATITAAGSATVAISGGGSVNEGADATFTVTLSASPGAAVVVDYATAAGTATAGSDFTATSGTLTFAAGATGDDLSQTFDVPVLADSIVEGTESFTATLSASSLPTGFSLDTTTATATITAAGSATVAISGGGNVNEGDDATFTVTLSASPGAAVVVDYATVAGTATAGSDFTATSGTLTFAAGATGDDLSQTFDVPVLADSIVEGTESFTATLSASSLPTGFSLDTTTATATITAAGSATVAISGGGSVNEGADATFTVTLSASPGAAVVVDYATAAGTATAGSDFTATSGTLTFAAGATGDDLSQTFDVPVLADSIVEGTESFTATLSANASTPLPTGFSLDTTTATATITAAGSATVAISGGGSVNEGADATFTVTLSASPGAAVVVDYATVAGTATAGSDFTATSGTLTFAAGATGDDLSQTFDVPVLADSIVEGTETFTATLSANASTPLPTGFSLDTTTATATITAAGSATVAISGGGNVNEGDDATFTVTLSASPGAAVVVDYATVAGTATAGSDFTATSGTLTFAAGATGDDLSQTFDVPVLADSIVEGTESFTATLSANASTPLPTGFSLDTTTATATITAAGSATVAISGGGNVNEGADATFTVTLSASPGAAVVVDYATAAGTATAGSDFTATSGTLTFAAGATGDDLSQTFDVPVLADSIVEGTESFTATLSASSLPTGFSLDTTTATATITAAGSATVAISGGGNVNEGDDATFTVTLSASPGAAVVVDYATVAGTATAGSDFTATSGTLTFAAGATGDDLSQTFDVPVLADSIVEGTESFTATLSANASTPLPTGFSLDTTTATATITAAGSATVAISGGGSVNEGADATFTVTLSASPGAAVVVDYATAAGTATAGSDFTATSGTLTFAAGATGDDLSQTFDVPVLADSIVEGTESFTATLSASSLPTGFSLDTTTATATITAAGSATVAISGGGNVNEGDDATFTVTLSASPGAAVVVDYATVAGTATAGSDFTATSGTLTFAAGATGDDLSQTFDVPVLADSIVEGTESFTATLSASSLPTGFSLDTTTATATITAAGSATVAISGGGSVNEGADATFTVTLSASPGAAVVVDYATAAGTATAGSDFTATSGTLTFAAGATGDDLSQTFDVPVLADSIVEGTESFTATLSANASTPLPTGFSLDTTTATATITAAGSATVAISGGGSVNEGADATFTVTLSAHRARQWWWTMPPWRERRPRGVISPRRAAR